MSSLSLKARDPRVEPCAGDTVTVGTETRQVERVRDGRVYYGWPGKLAVRSIHPAGWEAWAATATAWSAFEEGENTDEGATTS